MDCCRTCGKCCTHSEMILSSADIEQIEFRNDKSLKKEDFVFLNNENYYQIKNVDNHCIFYEPTSKSCTIYNFRPQGCIFYPMIYDDEKSKCILDNDCPYKFNFYRNPSIFKSVCRNLKNWIKSEIIKN